MTLSITLCATNDLDIKFFITTSFYIKATCRFILYKSCIFPCSSVAVVYSLWTVSNHIHKHIYSSIWITHSCLHGLVQGINLWKWNKEFVVWYGLCFLFLVISCVSQLRWLILCHLGEATKHGYLCQQCLEVGLKVSL